MQIGFFLGLPEPVLTLDLDVVEAVLEREAHDFFALRRTGAVGDERELDPELLQPVERLVRAGKHAQLGFLHVVEAVGDPVAQLGGRRRLPRLGTQFGKGVLHDVSARLADPVPPMLVPRLVGPEIARIGLNSRDDIVRRMRRQMLDELGDDALPLPLGLPEGREDRVIEIEQDRRRKLAHASS